VKRLKAGFYQNFLGIILDLKKQQLTLIAFLFLK
jgi:hypothetical protein